MPYQKHCPGCFHNKDGIAACPVCGYDESVPRPPLFLPHGIIIGGQYRVGRVLGQPGGFGITYLGWDVHLQQRVAIKEFLPRDIATRHPGQLGVVTQIADMVAAFEFGKEQFLREARIVAGLDHANVVRVRSFFNANGTAYLVMDYYEGLSLGDYLTQVRSVIEPALAVPLLRPVLDALQYVHERGVLHRDLKPHNIYLATVGKPIVLDFGAARHAASERAQSLSVVLTDGYAPLEQYQRRAVQGPWTDVYGVAATLYRMLTGTPPPTALDRLTHDPLAAGGWTGIPAPLRPALSQGLALAPEARFQSVADFVAALSEFRPWTAPPANEPASDEAAVPPVPPPAPALQPDPTPRPAAADPLPVEPAAAVEAPEAHGAAGFEAPDDLPTAVPPPPRRAFPSQPPTHPAQLLIEPIAQNPGAEFASRKPQTARWTLLAIPAVVVLAGLVLLLTGWLRTQSVSLSQSTAIAAVMPVVATEKSSETAKPAAAPAEAIGSGVAPLLPPLLLLPAGELLIGDDRGDASERPAHRVSVERFAIAAREITVEEFSRFVEATAYRNPRWVSYPCQSAGSRDPDWDHPGYAQTSDRPVVCVSAVDAQAYVRWLSRSTGERFRLPTEAEWEYAARAGSSTRYWWGDSYDSTKASCANCPSARSGPLPAGRWPANRLGLFDTAGNVREWTCSVYEPYGESAGSETRCAKAALRSVRGGSWHEDIDALRSARRSGLEAEQRDVWTGFRVVQSVAGGADIEMP